MTTDLEAVRFEGGPLDGLTRDAMNMPPNRHRVFTRLAHNRDGSMEYVLQRVESTEDFLGGEPSRIAFMRPEVDDD